ncbi:uncharacterized protein LOC125662331 isoform X1 [Ostrea edulis]|uniref:uncharacterized protein LOC125662331 isoform X1 n=1 Tax=Ostrea edulis TaxID=37623 RepID=UPI0024AF4032|nr:uncharacterized protein LOC125662331 isoform X1 [Ostrea edulis]
MASRSSEGENRARLFNLPKRKRQSLSFTDSSSSDTRGNRGTKYKKPQHDADSVSNWTTKTLNEYGIMYKNNPVTIEEFTNTIKSKANEVCEKTDPDFLSTLVMLSKRGLAFSLDIPERVKENKLSESSDKVLQILRDFDAFVNEILEKEEKYIGSEVRNKTLFFTWTYSVRSFLNYYKKFLEIVNISLAESMLTKPVMEAHLHELFMVFSRIFFLEPELGSKEVKRLIIGTKVVSCIPDVRFTCLNPQKHGVLMMLTEGKKDESFRENKSFESRRTRRSSESSVESDDDSGNYIHSLLDIHVLGRHGGELLSELRTSAFAPTMVFGCICVETEIIFTYLEMKGDHLNKIVFEGNCYGESSYIRYTKPLNYLMEEERSRCLDLLFLLGFIQTAGYEDLFPTRQGKK